LRAVAGLVAELEGRQRVEHFFSGIQSALRTAAIGESASGNWRIFMMNSWNRITKCLVALSLLGALNVASAAMEPQPSGTVDMASKSLALGVGAIWGDGTLHFQGTNHKFSLQGLTVVDVGASAVTTAGEVFNLKNPADFAGNYIAGAAGLAIAGGANDVIMRNDHGVVLRLHGIEKGVRLQLGAQGVSITMKS
jgi:hypothetical protein